MIRVLAGDNREKLRELPDASVHCVVTSPPYLGLRDYKVPPTIWGGDPDCAHDFSELVPSRKQTGGTASSTLGEASGGHAMSDAARLRSIERQTHEGQPSAFCASCGAWRGVFGMEPNPGLYVEHLLEVFREIWRVVRTDGVVFLNLGDSYWSHAGGQNGLHSSTIAGGQPASLARPHPKPWGPLKTKDLVGIPWRVAFALQDAGWWLRRDIIWAKGASFGPYHGNPMTESVKDRPSSSHEYVFLLTKSPRYFYDHEAVKEPQAEHERTRRLREQASGLVTRYILKRDGHDIGQHGPGANGVARSVEARHRLAVAGTRNLRSVWTIPTVPSGISHFATFPPDLVEPMVKAGTSERGCCPRCGAPWERIVEEPDFSEAPKRKTSRLEGQLKSHGEGFLTSAGQAWQEWRNENPSRTVGWRPTCAHEETPVPCTVVDPFAGAGTVGLVADRLGRDAILIDLNTSYIDMAAERIRKDAPLLADVRKDVTP